MPRPKFFPRAIGIMAENAFRFIKPFSFRNAFRVCFNYNFDSFLKSIFFTFPYLCSRNVSTESGNKEKVSAGGSYHTETDKGYQEADGLHLSIKLSIKSDNRNFKTEEDQDSKGENRMEQSSRREIYLCFYHKIEAKIGNEDEK